MPRLRSRALRSHLLTRQCTPRKAAETRLGSGKASRTYMDAKQGHVDDLWYFDIAAMQAVSFFKAKFDDMHFFYEGRMYVHKMNRRLHHLHCMCVFMYICIYVQVWWREITLWGNRWQSLYVHACTLYVHIRYVCTTYWWEVVDLRSHFVCASLPHVL
jgi:hypothetical protein